jgi:hypothetical protein
LLLLTSAEQYACLQAANEGRFVHITDICSAAPLVGMTLGTNSYIISPYAGMDLDDWTKHEAPSLPWSSFISHVQTFTMDLLIGGVELAELVSPKRYVLKHSTPLSYFKTQKEDQRYTCVTGAVLARTHG